MDTYFSVVNIISAAFLCGFCTHSKPKEAQSVFLVIFTTLSFLGILVEIDEDESFHHPLLSKELDKADSISYENFTPSLSTDFSTMSVICNLPSVIAFSLSNSNKVII
jgi:hypothetical protein